MIGSPFQSRQPIIIERSCLVRFSDLAKSALPHEAAALLTGYDHHITDLVPIEVMATPETFSLSPQLLLQELHKIRERKQEWIGLIHSHPTMPAIPSSADTAGWHYPMLSYWILSLASEPSEVVLYRWMENAWQSYPYEVK